MAPLRLLRGAFANSSNNDKPPMVSWNSPRKIKELNKMKVERFVGRTLKGGNASYLKTNISAGKGALISVSYCFPQPVYLLAPEG